MKRTIGAVFALLTCTVVNASPASYRIDFNVDMFFSTYPGQVIDPRVEIGSRYYGFFTVDDALLAHDGLYQSGVVSAFRVQFEDIVWDMNQHYPLSEFSGFRGPGGLFDASPGFDVLGGTLVNLRGGVFGIVDEPFIDFSFDPDLPQFPNQCPGPLACGNAPNRFSTINPLGGFRGSMYVVRVPEPPPLTLMLMGIIGGGLSLALRRSNAN